MEKRGVCPNEDVPPPDDGAREKRADGAPAPRPPCGEDLPSRLAEAEAARRKRAGAE